MIFQIILGLAMLILGYLLMPKPKKAKPDAVTELESPTAETGIPIGVVFGDIVSTEGNFLWWGDKGYSKHEKESSKK